MTTETTAQTFGHIIAGKEVAAADGSTFPAINPYTQQEYARVAQGRAADVDAAIQAARAAFDSGVWSGLGYGKRSALIARLADLIERETEALARAETIDMGKPIAQSRHDIGRTVANFRFFADHAKVSESAVYPSDTGHHAYTRYEAAGVVVAIAPWNFPMMLESWKVAPALAWGNTVVLKPSEDSSATATMMGRLAIEAGFPDGVLNVVHGAGETGGLLTSDDRVDRITFTGSSATGRIIAQAAGSRLIPVSLELGGKGANVVFDDADLDNAVHWSCEAIFRNAGQVCLAGSRLFVQRGIYDAFMEKFVAAAKALVPGDPLNEGTTFGPLASVKHHKKVTGYLDTIEANGGTVVTGGRAGDGLFVEPTIVTGLGTDTPHYREEIFGPLVVVTPFDTEDEAAALANGTPYGLNAIEFTENLSRAHRFAAKLKAGTVWTNTFFIRDLRAPFGGVGHSGVGREGGNFSREFFTEPKAIVMQISDESE